MFLLFTDYAQQHSGLSLDSALRDQYWWGIGGAYGI